MKLLTPDADRPCRHTVLLVRTGDQPWHLVTIRWRDRLLARVRELDLDRALATGHPADHDRLRALRAATLVAPAARRRLAGNWERVLTNWQQPAGPWEGRVPLQRARVREAADPIRELVGTLRAAGPVPARGVALAHLLLTDATGPLYNGRSRVDLADAVREAIHFLDPTVDVLGG
jgi:hypothetical protein